MGIGEKLEALEPFYPDRIAQRILGMGDVLSLVEEVERKIDKEKADKMAKKLRKGGGFDLNDLLIQFQQMKAMGGMAGFLDKMPGMSNSQLQQATASGAPEKMMKQMEAIIQSMTPQERHKPDVINGSRKRRIAGGAGVQIQDVNRLLKQHQQMEKMMKKLATPSGITKMIRGMKGLQNKFGASGGGMDGAQPPMNASELAKMMGKLPKK
jgi:signal recognition particle subunit SRP54